MATELRGRILALIALHGVSHVARLLGVSRHSLSAYAGDLPRRPATTTHVEMRASVAFARMVAAA